MKDKEQKTEEATASTNTAGPEASAAPEAAGNGAQESVDVENLQKQAAKAAEHWDRLLRTTADFDNFKKRATREKQDAIKYANESLLEKLMPVLDSFEKALSATKTAAPATATTSEALEKGVELVFAQLKQILKDAGLEEIDATSAVFDPNLHEAISAQEAANIPEGQVLHQLRKGYKLRERLLRPATVIVAKAPEAKPSP